MPSFEDLLKKIPEPTNPIPGKLRVKKPKRPKHIQAQKYALVPKWRRRRGGKTGQKI